MVGHCIHIFDHLSSLYILYCIEVCIHYHCSLDPDNDPLCVLLMIDYFSLRAAEYKFLTRLCDEWEVTRVIDYVCIL